MPAHPAVIVVSLSCRFPDAASPEQLWSNVLEGRRSFRALPAERLDLTRYAASLVGEADAITPIHAGLLTNWSFDCAHFKIPTRTYESTDLTHWLALELAARAIADIGGPTRFDRSRTAVIVANTLAGEFARASLLRLRAPFLDGVLARSAREAEIAPETEQRLRRNFTSELRRHFPDPNEESLAGGLANTIAGRIANHFDLHGGAYTVDGACASSLVAIADAANLIVSGQVDAAIVGAVDLSLDPFELVGFSRNGALAGDEMRVFDARSNGFWPGEGGAFAILMSESKAAEAQLAPLVRLRGWGLSTDGAGGLTRPSAEGQLLASRRACEAAGVDPADLAFVEAHGTGTAVGDPIELRALAALRHHARRSLPVGSIKANIGHTKAAAGFAGLIKAAAALQHGVVPPHVGCANPHRVFRELDDRVRPAIVPERIGAQGALAGISSFGFGGVNAHVVLEAATPATRTAHLPRPRANDAELFIFAGEKEEVLLALTNLEHRAATMSMAELVDAAAELGRSPIGGPVRVALVASRANELAEGLQRAMRAVADEAYAGANDGAVFVGYARRAPRVGFVFPGQVSPSRPDGGLWARCFDRAAAIVNGLPLDPDIDKVAAPIAQPAITAANLAGLTLLERLGIRADVALGHSLGEIAALAWAGALDLDTALDLARNRGEITARYAVPGGTMLRVALSASQAEALCPPEVVIACRNGPADTVLAGPRDPIGRLASRCAERGTETTRIPVSHAFHSVDMAGAVAPLRDLLRSLEWRPLNAAVVSAVTGDFIEPGMDLPELLAAQLTACVQFDAALTVASRHVDLFVEVGPGHGLSRLLRERDLLSFAIDGFGPSLRPLLATLAELHVRGCELELEALYADRPVRSFSLSVPSFIASPCGTIREPAVVQPVAVTPPLAPAAILTTVARETGSWERDPLAAVLAVIAAETGLAAGNIGLEDHFLDDLHLNSLVVSRIVLASARTLGVHTPSAPTEFANATARQLCDALRELRDLAGAPGRQRIGGVRPWVAPYAVRWTKAAASRRLEPGEWSVVTISDREAPSLPPGGKGWLLQVAGPFNRAAAERLIAAAAQAARLGVPRLAIVHEDAPVSGFARSLALEQSFQSVRVIGGVGPRTSSGDLTAALERAASRYSECRLDDKGAVTTPVFAPTEPACAPAARVSGKDVAVVIGGGRGIAAECALCLGNIGTGLILVGRSGREAPEVARTLARAERTGMRCVYVRADVADPEGLTRAIAAAAEKIGAPTVLLHAAGVNEPMRIVAVDDETARRSLMPKMDGFANAIAACGPALRRVISFGSLIGAIGLEGEAHYALANAALTDAAQAWARAEPGRSNLALEWSIWAGAGMGERLGTIERLEAVGVDPISVDDAIETFDRLVRSGACGTLAITSRFGPPPDLHLGELDLPPLRFVDRPIIHFPGQEIVLETALGRGRDLYLDDHVIDGRHIFPATMALEAMAQAASCLCPLGPVVAIQDVAFQRAITVARGGEMRIRLAALRSKRGIEVVLLTGDDDFSAPAVRALFTSAARLEPTPHPAWEVPPERSPFAAEALYGPLFFNGGRFRRLDRFTQATSRDVAATFCPADPQGWFGSYEPQQLSLWDPGGADAALHALQIAVPHRRVLPISTERIEVVRDGTPARMRAIERDATAGTYVFDIELQDRAGRTIQRWYRAVFRSLGALEVAPTLAAEPRVAAPYLERLAREALGDDSITIALVSDRESPRDARRAAALAALGIDDAIERRSDGKLIRSDGAGFVSLAHCNGVTIAVSAQADIGCDLEHIGSRLASRGFVAMEACRKLGRRINAERVETIPAGLPVEVDGVTLLTLDLPDCTGLNTVALSRHTTDPS